MLKSQTIIKECTVVANGLVTHFTLRNVGPGANMSDTNTQRTLSFHMGKWVQVPSTN